VFFFVFTDRELWKQKKRDSNKNLHFCRHPHEFDRCVSFFFCKKSQQAFLLNKNLTQKHTK
jgi:hypothetical protein